MPQYLKDLITKENITFMIAVVGCLLSIWNFFETRYHNHVHLELVYKAHFYGMDVFLLQMAFENHSRLPICVSRIFIEISSYSFEFNWIPETVLEITQTTGKTITDEIKIRSLTPPIKIEALGIVGGILVANFSENIISEILNTSSCNLLLYTNRGIKRFPLVLSNPNIDY